MMLTDRGNRSAGGKSVTVPLRPLQNTWTDAGSNSCLRGERPATDRLSHGTATAVGIISQPTQTAHTCYGCLGPIAMSVCIQRWHTPNIDRTLQYNDVVHNLISSANSPSTSVLGLSLRGQHCSTLAHFLSLLRSVTLPSKQRRVFEHAPCDLLYVYCTERSVIRDHKN
jgi:hypothetical protein